MIQVAIDVMMRREDGGDGSLWLYLITLEINTSESESESFSVRGEPLRWLKLRLPRGILLHFQVENFVEKHLDIEEHLDIEREDDFASID